MLKAIAIIACACAAVSTASAKGGGGHSGYSAPSSTSSSHSVSGYTKSNGTYVAPYHATNSNATKVDNWSSKPNVNPHTGVVGTKDPNK